MNFLQIQKLGEKNNLIHTKNMFFNVMILFLIVGLIK